jgi:hypothetical protein
MEKVLNGHAHALFHRQDLFLWSTKTHFDSWISQKAQRHNKRLGHDIIGLGFKFF